MSTAAPAAGSMDAWHLWGSWRSWSPTSALPDHDTVTVDVEHVVTAGSRADLPQGIVVALRSGTATVVRAEPPATPAGDPALPFSVTLRAFDVDNPASLRDHLGVKVFHKPSAGGRAIGHRRLRRVEAHGAEPTTFTVPASLADQGPFFAVLANTGSNDLGVRLTLDNAQEPGFVLAMFGGSVGAVDWLGATMEPACDDGAGGPDLGDSARTDVQPITRPDDGWAVTYPYNRWIRLFGRSACDELHTVELDPAGPGPMAVDATPDGRYLVAALADPADPCAPGGVGVVDLAANPEPAVVAVTPLPIGATDIRLVNGPAGVEALVTQTGDGDACFSSFLRAVPFADALAGGFSPEPGIVTNIVVAGESVENPTRLSATDDRDWVAWTADNAGGRIGIMRTGDHAVFVPTPPNRFEDPWVHPRDVEITWYGNRLGVYFLTAEASATWVDAGAVCNDDGIGCSGYSWFIFDPASEEMTLQSRRVLPWRGAHRLAITRDLRRGFVAYENRRQLTVLALGPVELEQFRIDPVTPVLDGEPTPSEIWLPRE